MSSSTGPVCTLDELRARLADNLRHLRARAGLSQERLALEADVDRTMVSKIERRISNPSLETLLRLANRLGVDLALLLMPESGPPRLVSAPPLDVQGAAGRRARLMLHDAAGGRAGAAAPIGSVPPNASTHEPAAAPPGRSTTASTDPTGQ